VSAFDHVGTLAPQQIWDGVLARAVRGAGVTLTLIELDPGSVVPTHSHENEQLGILLEGSLEFTIGGETGEVRAGGTWNIGPHVPHSVVTGPDGAVLVEVFAPARSDWEAIERQAPRPPLWPKTVT
jgi:quercetin dioxygenase-like cupin family protein